MKFTIINSLISKLNAAIGYEKSDFDLAFENGTLMDTYTHEIPTIANGDTYLECVYDSSKPFTQASWHGLTDLATQLHEDPIMDVLRGWEMEDGSWLQDSPLVLRFELQDVILMPAEDGSMQIWHGILDDESDCLLQANWLPNAAHLANDQRSRLHRERCRMGAGVSQACWIPYSPLFDLIGLCTTVSDWLALAQRIHTGSQPIYECVQLLMKKAA